MKVERYWIVLERNPRSRLYSIHRGASRFRLIAYLYYLYHKKIKKRDVRLFKLEEVSRSMV